MSKEEIENRFYEFMNATPTTEEKQLYSDSNLDIPFDMFLKSHRRSLWSKLNINE